MTVDTASPAAPERSGAALYTRLAALAALIVLLVVAGRYVGGYIPRFAAWVETFGAWGPLVFIVGYAISVVAFVPASALTLAAGAVFGLARGTAYVFVAATIGACAAFAVARYFARAAVERKLQGNRRFAAVDRAVAEQGRRIVFLLRLSPVFPFNVLNYALGLTNIRFLDYALACAGMLPGTLLYVYLGYVGGRIAGAASGEVPAASYSVYVLQGVGLAATIAVTVSVTRIARRALAHVTADEHGR